jgi:putative ABC transport system ATP-binding protein
MPSIVTTDLRKTYGEGEAVVHAVDGINFTMEPGEFVAIIGPSGSGKSTLLNLLGCLDLPSEGHVIIDGEDTAVLSQKALTRLRRQKIGFVFQEFNLLPVLDAVENVELPLRYLGVHTKERRDRSLEALAEVGLEKRVNNRPSQMSGGERQRVAIARALVTRPALVLADEPTGELDTANTCRVIELMRKLNDDLQQTFAVVTHDPMVASYARRVISLRDGAVVSDEPQEAAPISCD